jgi:hypothetical protein
MTQSEIVQMEMIGTGVWVMRRGSGYMTATFVYNSPAFLNSSNRTCGVRGMRLTATPVA